MRQRRQRIDRRRQQESSAIGRHVVAGQKDDIRPLSREHIGRTARALDRMPVVGVKIAEQADLQAVRRLRPVRQKDICTLDHKALRLIVSAVHLYRGSRYGDARKTAKQAPPGDLRGAARVELRTSAGWLRIEKGRGSHLTCF